MSNDPRILDNLGRMLDERPMRYRGESPAMNLRFEHSEAAMRTALFEEVQ